MTPEAAAAQALLFVTDEPLSSVTLSEALGLDVSTVEDALYELQEALAASEGGIILEEVAGGWRLFTNPLYHDIIEKFVLTWDARRLTSPALEVLAIIAYTQPVTRARISSYRGVNSDSTLRSLVDKGLVAPVGTEDTPGNPVTYGTTRAFLEHFGLASLEEMEPLESFAPDPATRELIVQRLSARGLTGVSGGIGELSSEEAQDSLGFAEEVDEQNRPSFNVDLSSLTFNFDDE